MMSLGVSLRLFFLCPAFSLPVPTQLSKEDEMVVKCISEILADTLSRSSPMPVTSECMKMLREDERVLALLQHRHLLTELEELAHQENAKHLLAHEINHNSGEEKQQGELQKSDGLAQQKEAERAGRKKEDEKEEEEEKEVMKKDEKTKKPQEKIKVSQKEDGQDSLEERDVEEEQEEKETKERTASETWYSKEYFGHVKKRGSRQPQIRKGMLRGEEEGQEREEVGKRRLRMGEEERDDPSEEEEQKKYHPGGHSEDESWEEEEERSTVAKRVAEKASDEETAQFEEDKGLQSSRAHLHKSWKPWKEEAEEEEEEEEEHDKTRHGHHHPSVGLELRKRHGKEEVDPKGRHHAPEEEEEEEEEEDTRQRKAQEVEKLEEIERQLKWAADSLEELKRG